VLPSPPPRFLMTTSCILLAPALYTVNTHPSSTTLPAWIVPPCSFLFAAAC
jgi:hypothetical protein